MAYVITYLVSLIIVAPVAVISGLADVVLDNPLHTKFWANLAAAAISGVGQTASGSILNPWSAAVTALVYIDLRMRREGLDLDLLRAADAREAQ